MENEGVGRHWPSFRVTWLRGNLRHKGLSPRAHVVAQFLALEFADDQTGYCVAGQHEMAERAGVHPDTVKVALRELRVAGRVERQSGNGRGNRSEWLFLG